jgi:hypothetical protein
MAEGLSLDDKKPDEVAVEKRPIPRRGRRDKRRYRE